MRGLGSAASAAFIVVVGVSATSAVLTARARSAPVSSSQPGSAHLATITPTGAGPAAPATATDAKTTQVASRGPFAWPLFPRPVVIRPFDQPRDQWSPGHRGVDLLAAVGQPVLSAGEGIVAFSGVVAGRGVLTVQHPGGLRTTYEPVDERLASGTRVDRGTQVAVLSAEPGHCAPRRCLHWGAISGQTYRDPLSLLGFGRPILLPLG